MYTFNLKTAVVNYLRWLASPGENVETFDIKQKSDHHILIPLKQNKTNTMAL